MKPCAGSFCFHSCLPAEKATTSLSCVTTAATVPSLPTPAASGAPAAVRHNSRPLPASIAATDPSLAATVAVLPLTATARGKPTVPMRTDQACRMPSKAGLACSSAGLGFSTLLPKNGSEGSAEHPARWGGIRVLQVRKQEQ